jgi:predicted Fe-S protein YdhL (DUF1289 family)
VNFGRWILGEDGEKRAVVQRLHDRVEQGLVLAGGFSHNQLAMKIH